MPEMAEHVNDDTPEDGLGPEPEERDPLCDGGCGTRWSESGPISYRKDIGEDPPLAWICVGCWRRKEAPTFEDELRDLINRHSQEGASNTPDFVLARYLVACLEAWEDAIERRDDWHTKELKEERDE